MAVEEEQRNYNLTDPELCQFTSNLVGDMTRDVAQFQVFGIDASDISAMQGIGNQFEVFPSDEMLEGEVIIATTAKNEKLEQVKEGIRNMAMRIEMKWGANSGQYYRLGIKGMNNFSDEAMIYTSRRVHSVISDYLLDLASEGLTQQMLDDYEDLCQEYEDSKNAQHDKINIRDVKRVERIRLGNQLYDIVSKYCEIGKRIWFKVDPAKYDDYVIYPGGGGTGPTVPPAAPELYYSPDGFAWDEVPTATSYELVYRASSETEWTELYSGPFPEGSIAFAPGEGDWVARLRARNSAGFGAWSEERNVFFGLHAPQNVAVIFTGLPDNFLRVSWSNVTGADYNEIWRSMVAVGQPEGTFTKVGERPSPPFQEVSTPAMRYYYYVIAKSTEYTSPHSDTVFFDVPV